MVTSVANNVPYSWCSYCVSGVEGVCANLLATEFYTVLMLLTFILIISNIIIIISIPSPPHCFIPDLNLPFLQILSTAAFVFFFRTDSADLPILLSISASYFLFIFCFLSIFNYWFHAVD